jgi:flagellar biosynthesis protein FlhG
VRQLSGPAGITLVVTTDEPTSLTDAYAFIKVTHAVNPKADLRVVVNMATNTREGERTYNTILKACQNFLKFAPPLAGIVRRDQKVRDAIRNQTPLLVRSPGSDAAKDVNNIAAKLFAQP